MLVMRMRRQLPTRPIRPGAVEAGSAERPEAIPLRGLLPRRGRLIQLPNPPSRLHLEPLLQELPLNRAQ